MHYAQDLTDISLLLTVLSLQILIPHVMQYIMYLPKYKMAPASQFSVLCVVVRFPLSSPNPFLR